MTSMTQSGVSHLGLSAALPPRGLIAANSLKNGAANSGAGELREKFTQFVGEAFFGQMIKSMRLSVGKPAYFHGGRAEEVFQGQLDQKLAEHLTQASASRFAEPMFEHQFPKLAERENHRAELDGLAQLARR